MEILFSFRQIKSQFWKMFLWRVIFIFLVSGKFGYLIWRVEGGAGGEVTYFKVGGVFSYAFDTIYSEKCHRTQAEKYFKFSVAIFTTIKVVIIFETLHCGESSEGVFPVANSPDSCGKIAGYPSWVYCQIR